MSTESRPLSAEEVENKAAQAHDDAPDSAPGAQSAGSTVPQWLLLGSAAFTAAALLAAVIFGIQWWVSASDDNAGLAATREDVVRVGTVAVKAFTELDYTKPDEYFDRSLAIATDDIGKQIAASKDNYKKQMVQAKSVATTRVLDVAVDELNDHEGKARFLAAVQVEVKQGDQSSVKPMRLEVQMTRVGQDWKLSGIDQVPVVGAGQ
jgi:Mce-associated membrane protein